MPTSFACPECRTVLKTKADVPAGKKVKCPKCAKVFAAPEPETKTFTAVRAASSAGAAPPGQGKVRSGKPPAAPAGRRASAREDDDDDREERRSRKKSKKRKKKQQSNLPLLLGLGGGAGALIIAFLILGLVWPGFLVSQKTKKAPSVAPQPVAANSDVLPKGTGEEDLLNFFPAGCSVFFGLNVKQIDQQPQLKSLWQSVLQVVQAAPDAPKKLSEVAANLDQAIVGTMAGQGPSAKEEPVVFVLRMKSAYEPKAMRQLLEANDAPEPINGKTCYRLKDDPGQPSRANVMYMPNDRVLMLVDAPKDKLEKAFTAAGQAPVISPQAVAEVRKVEKACVWVAMEMTPSFQQMLANPPPDMPPDLRPAIGPLQKIPGAGVRIEMEDGKLAIRAGATCASEAEGQQLKQALENFWEKSGKLLVGGAQAFAPPDLAGIMDEITSSLAFKVDSAQVSAEITLGEKTLQTMTTFLQTQANQIAAALRAGPGGQAGQPPPPERRPGRRPLPTPGGKRPGGRPPGN